MIIEFNSSGIGMFMMVLKELWDSFVKSHKVFCRYCCNILIYDIMSSWTRRFLTNLNRVLVFRKLLLWAWNFLWGFIFRGCHFIIETVFVVAGNFTFFAFPWRILSETSAIGSKVKLLSVYKGGDGVVVIEQSTGSSPSQNTF